MNAIAHDVFVSYATQDKPTADAVCSALESKNIRCWIAPRDILPGGDWSAAIIEAIEGARVMVLVFSARANASPQITREVERAVSKGLTIIPLRIEQVQPGRNLEYFLGTPHWLDAMTPPLERHLDYLAETVQFLLERGERPAAFEQFTPSLGQRLRRNKRIWPLLALPVVALIALIAAFALGAFSGGNSNAEPTVLDPVFVGTWRLETLLDNASDGSSSAWTFDVPKGGDYKATVEMKDSGAVQYDAATKRLTMEPKTAPAGYVRTIDWQQSGDTANLLTSNLVPPSMMQYMTAIGAIQPIGLNSLLSSTEPWTRPAGGDPNSIAGVWSREAKYGALQWHITFEITQDMHYTFDAILDDNGTLAAHNGRWALHSQVIGLPGGTYNILDNDSIVITFDGLQALGPAGQGTFRRLGPAQ